MECKDPGRYIPNTLGVPYLGFPVESLYLSLSAGVKTIWEVRPNLRGEEPLQLLQLSGSSLIEGIPIPQALLMFQVACVSCLWLPSWWHPQWPDRSFPSSDLRRH